MNMIRWMKARVSPRLVAVPLALGVLGLAACGSSTNTTSSTTASAEPTTTSTSTTQSALIGKHTSLALNPANSKLLAENGITVTAVAPATYSKTLVLPVDGGQVAVATVKGTINHTGGVKLSHGEKSITVTSFIVDTSAEQVTALIGGQRVPVFAINPSAEKHETEAGGVIVDQGLQLTLTEPAADALNSALGVTAFKSGQVFATATMTLAVKT